jgi:CheY-like chemotaxis protein
VLVVDDNEDAADTFGTLLGHLGVQVRVAYNGEAALELFASLRPSLVFVDIGMPLMDGYELTRRLRAQFPGAATTIVALSGWGQEEDIRRGREAGFDHQPLASDSPALAVLLLCDITRALACLTRGQFERRARQCAGQSPSQAALRET